MSKRHRTDYVHACLNDLYSTLPERERFLHPFPCLRNTRTENANTGFLSTAGTCSVQRRPNPRTRASSRNGNDSGHAGPSASWHMAVGRSQDIARCRCSTYQAVKRKKLLRMFGKLEPATRKLTVVQR